MTDTTLITALPAASIRQRLPPEALKRRQFFGLAWVYLVMLLVMAPLVWAMSFNPHFQDTYPFYHHPTGAPLWP